MYRTNCMITIGLGVLAAVWWWLASVQTTLLPSYPSVQIPLGYSLTALVGLGWVLSFLSRKQEIGETCCRRCRHILRGLSEPRCPECGERI